VCDAGYATGSSTTMYECGADGGWTPNRRTISCEREYESMIIGYTVSLFKKNLINK